MDEALYLIIRRNMDERDLYDSMQNLNPCVDKLGKERDFKDAVIRCIRYLEDKIDELERRFDETTTRPK